MISGCVTVTHQVDGRPIADNIAISYITDSEIQVQTALMRVYKIREADEFLDTYEYLDGFSGQQAAIDQDNTDYLAIVLDVKNPKREHYKIKTSNKIKLDIGPEYTYSKVHYAGNLSRKDAKIYLPLVKNASMTASYGLQDPDDYPLLLGFTFNYRLAPRKKVVSLKYEPTGKSSMKYKTMYDKPQGR